MTITHAVAGGMGVQDAAAAASGAVGSEGAVIAGGAGAGAEL
jgi:hypothetical protein